MPIIEIYYQPNIYIMEFIPKKAQGCCDLNTLSADERVCELEKAAGWLAKEIGGMTDGGAYGEAAIGCPAVEYFKMRAYEKVFGGKWTVKPGEDLSKRLFKVMWSDKGHWVRDWREKCGEPYIIRSVDLTPSQMAEVECAAISLDDAVIYHDKARDFAYELAENLAHDDPEILSYLKAMKKNNDYREIGRSMHKSKDEVAEIESRLMDIIYRYRKSQKSHKF